MSETDVYSPIIAAEGVRPFMDAGGELPKAEEKVGIRTDFEMLCNDVLSNADPIDASTLPMTGVKVGVETLPEGYVDPSYQEGWFAVTVGELPSKTSPFGNPQITVTYFKDEIASDEEEPHSTWRMQSTYEIKDGALVRIDRRPPTADEDALSELADRQGTIALSELGRRQMGEIAHLGETVRNALEQLPPDDDFNAHRIVTDSEFDYASSRRQYTAESEALQRNLSRRRSTSNPNGLLEQLGMNCQPVSKQEADKLDRLVRLVFKTPSY